MLNLVLIFRCPWQRLSLIGLDPVVSATDARPSFHVSKGIEHEHTDQKGKVFSRIGFKAG